MDCNNLLSELWKVRVVDAATTSSKLKMLLLKAKGCSEKMSSEVQDTRGGRHRLLKAKHALTKSTTSTNTAATLPTEVRPPNVNQYLQGTKQKYTNMLGRLSIKVYETK
jgi:hypothetical protein